MPANKRPAVLRSEGYYDAVVEPEIGDGDSAQPYVNITPGPRTRIVDPLIAWSGDAPDPAANAAAQTEMALKSGAPAPAPPW